LRDRGPTNTSIPVEESPVTGMIDCLRNMLVSREADRREAMSMRQGKGWMQIPSSGHEAMAALAYALGPDDYVFPSYRDRALMLARGVTPVEMALDFLARTGSSSEGRNLPGHFSSRQHNIFSIASPTASQCLPAVGAAWGIKQGGSSHVVTCHIGDASTRQGEFYEAVCMAVQEQLPIVFVVEDNRYGISTRTDHMMPLRLGIFAESLVEKIDGRNASCVYERGGQAIARARAGLGPTILWCELDRLGSHTSSDDHSLYRSAAELAEISARDPIRLFADELIASDTLTEGEFDAMRASAIEIVAEAARVAESTAPVDPIRAVYDVLARPRTVPRSVRKSPGRLSEIALRRHGPRTSMSPCLRKPLPPRSRRPLKRGWRHFRIF